jgi:hypothetical protein
MFTFSHICLSMYLIGQVCLRFIAICRVLQQQENEDITQGIHMNVFICIYYKHIYAYGYIYIYV